MPEGIDFDGEFFAWLGNSPEVVGLLYDAAQGIQDVAVASAPEDEGDYKRSIHLEVAQHAYRKTVKVVADDPKALLIEARTGNLARALNRAASLNRKG